MAAVVIAIVAAVVVAAAAALLAARSRSANAAAVSRHRAAPPPPLAGFHVEGEDARVLFEVPLPAEGADDVLRELLLREAVEVVREKRHSLPISGVKRVVALARRGEEWETVGALSLDIPGRLPPPALPEILPGLGRDPAFDPFDRFAALPGRAPGLAGARGGDTLGPIAGEIRLPAAVANGLRAQGVDPAAADAGDLILGIMRLHGAVITSRDADTWEAVAGGTRTLVRVVPHHPGDHPELGEASIRRFAADFATSGAERAVLITEKYSPFEVYERERRDPRARYITRERIQPFIDAMSLS
jgi:hypothetical protein